MAVRFFGQYLLECGVIGAQQLLEALDQQRRMNVRFGQVAVAAGLLNEQQILEILRLQRKENLKIGEAAVKLGFMTSPQVERVLRAQRNHHVMLGEALVEMGALSREAIDLHLTAFKAEQAQYKVAVEIAEGLDPTGLAAPAIDLTIKLLFRLGGIRAKLVECTKGIPPPGSGSTFWVRIRFDGDAKGEIALMASPTVAAGLTTAILERQEDDAAVIRDTLKEFLNVVAGNLTTIAAKKGGRSMEIYAPEDGRPVPGAGGHDITASLSSPEGALAMSLLLE